MVVELRAIRLFLFETWVKYATRPWFDNDLDWLDGSFGSKHDRIKARQENPKLDENPNFGIMEGFDEAEGSGNIYRKGQSSDWSLLKIFSSSEREKKNIRDWSRDENMPEGSKIT